MLGGIPVKKYAMAYAVDSSLPLFTEEDLQCLTHINLAFGTIREGRVDVSGLTNIGLME